MFAAVCSCAFLFHVILINKPIDLSSHLVLGNLKLFLFKGNFYLYFIGNLDKKDYIWACPIETLVKIV